MSDIFYDYMTADRDLYKATCMADDALIKQLQAKVKELEEFIKHDYISMKNWQEEKATLQAKVEELTAFIKHLKAGWITAYDFKDAKKDFAAFRKMSDD